MAVLQYDFAVVGTQGINKAFARIERDAKRHSQRMDRIMGRPSAATGANAAPVAAKQAKKAATDTVKTVDNSARQKDRLEQQYNRRLLARFKRETVAAEREAKRQADAKAREAKRASAERERLEQRDHRRALRRFKRETIAANREAQRQAAARVASRRAFVGGVGSSVRGAIGGAGRVAGTALGLGGGFAVASAVGHTIGLEREASELSNQAYREGVIGKDDRESTRRSVMQQTRTIGEQTGIGALPLVGALRKFVEPSGRLDIGQAMLPAIAEFSDATGASIEDVGKTAGQVVQAMVTRDPTVQLADVMSETEAILSTVAGQAKVGAIEFKDMATLMGKLMSATAGFDGQLSDLAATLGAVGQISLAGGAASPEEAMTSILRFRDDLIKNQKKFKKAGGTVGGVNVFADEGMTKLRDPAEILAETMKATGGSLPEVSKLFGIRAAKAAQPFQAAFTEAGGGEAGAKAMDKVLESIRAAKMSSAERKGSAAFVRGGTGRKFAMEMERFKNSVGQDLLPTINDMLPSVAALGTGFADLVSTMQPLIEWFAKNPFKGLGAVVALKVGADIATAGVGRAIGKAVGESSAKSIAVTMGKSAFMSAGVYAAVISAAVAFFAIRAGDIVDEQEKREAAAKKAEKDIREGKALTTTSATQFGALKTTRLAAIEEQKRQASEALTGLSVRRDKKTGELVPGEFGLEAPREGMLSVLDEAIEDFTDDFGITNVEESRKQQFEAAKRAEANLKVLKTMDEYADKLQLAGKSAEFVAAEMERLAKGFGLAFGGGPDRTAGQQPVKGGNGKGPK